ncbi:hypothetical protein BDA99DRAFT_609485 [Phascolomyces articulosus]|uniref:RNB domain-containing protein n=1 Tax=Phascolomyces articulosus TaxID=60185 RepID=A0AAD5JZA6_9FUNG|nr:hypothetical protein BDA99DRAFT_609485 [Phascolomyces articulosus]
MMEIFDLDGQTAPESTRGLFDSPPEAKKWTTSTTERRHSSTLDLSSSTLNGDEEDSSTLYQHHHHSSRTKSTSFVNNNNNNNNNNGNKLRPASALHTVNEESDIPYNPSKQQQRLMQQDASLQRKHRSSAIFNNFPMGNIPSRHSMMHEENETEEHHHHHDDDDEDEEGNDGSSSSRANALAETEAKLIGAYSGGNNNNNNNNRGNHHRLSQQRRHSTSQQQHPSLGFSSSESSGYHNNNNYRRSTSYNTSEEFYGLRQSTDPFLQRSQQKSIQQPPPPVTTYHHKLDQQQQEKQNRRLSEPNARGYYRDTDHYEFQQRRSLNNNNNNNNNNHYNNKRTSLQWPPPRYDDSTTTNTSGDMVYDLDYKRSSMNNHHHHHSTSSGNNNNNNNNNKPVGLTLDTSRSSRRSSRNYGADWRASTSSSSLISSSARSPTSNRSSYNWVPFTPTRFSFPRDESPPSQLIGQQQGQQQGQRRALFVAHLPFSALVPLLKSHQLVSGILRVNKRNRSDAYVFCEEFNADIYICGSRDRNRALEGDVVAVKLVDVDKVIREKQEKEQAKVIRNHGQPIVRKPDEEDEKEIMFGGEEDVDKVKPKYCGVVVAILERAQNQAFSGTLGLTRPSNRRASTTLLPSNNKKESNGSGGDDEQDDSQQQQQNNHHHHNNSTPRIVWFKPTDKRVPLIAIPVEQAPPGFIESSQQFENKLFLGSIKRWPITSLHPFGVLENELGHVDDLSVQFRAILADNNFAIDPFPDTILRTLPQQESSTTPWTIPEDIRHSRLDWRAIRSFTIDTSTTHTTSHGRLEGDGILDNAISIQRKSDNVFEVGFHVADISAFVKPHSPMDKEAKARATSVYLYESAPLWPESLFHECTNLVPGQDRLAFSVVGKVDQYGKVLDIWYGKTIIRSQGILTINQMQDILDGVGVPEHITIEDQEKPEWEDDINMLYSLAQNMKQTRRRNGALFLSEPVLDISINDNGSPTGISLKQRLPADDIMDEIKILVNTSVAQKISSHFPDHALLQCQSMPNDRKLRELAAYLRSLGYVIDPSAASALQQTIDAIENEAAKTVITTLALKTMYPNKFFCTGKFDINRYHHYGLNAPLYTQFTSPSHRYADLIVHRQLEAALSGEKRFYLECEVIQKIARHCNVKGQSREYACEQSQHLFMSRYLSMSRQTATTHEAIVVGVQEQAFDVIVPGLILERRIHVINLPLETFNYSSTDGVLHLFWKRGVATADAMVEQADVDDDNQTIMTGIEGTGTITEEEDDLVDHHEEGIDGKKDGSLLYDNTITNGSNTLAAVVTTTTTSAPPSTADNAISEAVHQLSIKSAPSSADLPLQQEQQSTSATTAINNTNTNNNNNININTNNNKKQRPRSMSLRVIEGENPWTSQQECTIPNESRQVIRPFDYIRVVITSHPDRSPPLIRVLAANPFV